MASITDIQHMQHALRLATRQLGRTAPNPAVGCVIIKDHQIVGLGATGNGGRPHAETTALEMAGPKAEGATLYVTLEPCSHHGQTAPCSDAIIKAGIRKVVCACTDPDPRVSGTGIQALMQAGINVVVGICDEQAWQLNEGFFLNRLHKRPLVSLKIATSLDGKIATAKGESQWITGEAARQYGHKLRAQHDAILTGIGTVLADNPSLTCRIDGLEGYSPTRIIFDSQLRLPTDSILATSAKDVPVWVITTDEAAESASAAALVELGVTVLPCATKDGHIDLTHALAIIAEHGITRALVEPGEQLCTALLRDELVDQLFWFRAPLNIGNDGKAAIGSLPEQTLNQIARISPELAISLGDDLCSVYRLRPCLPVSSPTLAA